MKRRRLFRSVLIAAPLLLAAGFASANLIDVIASGRSIQAEKSLARAELHVNMRQYPAAIDLYEKSLDTDPGYDLAAFRLGQAYFQSGYTDLALDAWERLNGRPAESKPLWLQGPWLQDRLEAERFALIGQALPNLPSRYIYRGTWSTTLPGGGFDWPFGSDDIEPQLAGGDQHRQRILEERAAAEGIAAPVVGRQSTLADLERPLTPAEMIATPEGSVWMADFSAGSVVRMSRFNEVETVVRRLPVPLRAPSGMAIGPRGTLAVADFSSHVVHVLNEAGDPLFTVGIDGHPDGPLYEPVDVAYLGDQLAILEQPSGRLSLVSTSGRVTQVNSRDSQRKLRGATAMVADGNELLVFFGHAAMQRVSADFSHVDEETPWLGDEGVRKVRLYEGDFWILTTSSQLFRVDQATGQTEKIDLADDEPHNDDDRQLAAFTPFQGGNLLIYDDTAGDLQHFVTEETIAANAILNIEATFTPRFPRVQQILSLRNRLGEPLRNVLPEHLERVRLLAPPITNRTGEEIVASRWVDAVDPELAEWAPRNNQSAMTFVLSSSSAAQSMKPLLKPFLDGISRRLRVEDHFRVLASHGEWLVESPTNQDLVLPALVDDLKPAQTPILPGTGMMRLLKSIDNPEASQFLVWFYHGDEDPHAFCEPEGLSICIDLLTRHDVRVAFIRLGSGTHDNDWLAFAEGVAATSVDIKDRITPSALLNSLRDRRSKKSIVSYQVPGGLRVQSGTPMAVEVQMNVEGQRAIGRGVLIHE